MIEAERYLEVRARLERACERANRHPNDIEIVAVSKTYPSSAVRGFYEMGLRSFAENYVQELARKRAELADLDDLRFHLVGHLQRNKVRDALSAADVVQSVDSVRLVQALGANAASRIGCYVQVNLAGEVQKSGCREGEVVEIVSAMKSFPILEYLGLMTVAPASAVPEDSRPHFRRLRELGRRFDARFLSMGMSSDFEIAVEEGATHIRVGTSLFGKRLPRDAATL